MSQGEAKRETALETDRTIARYRRAGQRLLFNPARLEFPPWCRESEDLRTSPSKARVRLKAGSLFCSSLPISRKMPSSLWAGKGCGAYLPLPSIPRVLPWYPQAPCRWEGPPTSAPSSARLPGHTPSTIPNPPPDAGLT